MNILPFFMLRYIGISGKEASGSKLVSLSLTKGFAEANLAVVFCQELGITSLSCAVTQQV